LERQIRDLRMLRDALRHVADCPAPTHLECPSFRKLLKSTTRSRAVDDSHRRSTNTAVIRKRSARELL
jgi:hypothetical protein